MMLMIIVKKMVRLLVMIAIVFVGHDSDNARHDGDNVHYDSDNVGLDGDSNFVWYSMWTNLNLSNQHTVLYRKLNTIANM